MSYTNYRIRRNNQHTTVLIDDVTTLPSLFVLIYLADVLAQKKFGTQRNELISIKFFYLFWYQKNNETFDYSFYKGNYNISSCINELNGFFDYLLGKQYSLSGNEISHIDFSGFAISKMTKVSCAGHVRAVGRFLKFLNSRYINIIYQDISPTDAELIFSNNVKRLTCKIKEFSRIEIAKREPAYHYKSISLEQHINLNNMLLPTTPEFIADTGEIFEMQENPFNPFNTPFLQYRNFLIHRLMFNYGLRVGEVLLLTVDSFGTSQLDSRGKVKYLLSVENLPDHINDPRNIKPSIKTEYSNRIIEMDIDDFNYLTIFAEQHRKTLFNNSGSINKRKDHKLLFITGSGRCQPLSYSAIRQFYKKIDKRFIALHPHYRSNNSISDMVRLTPHVGRHTWAYMTLEFIYNELLKNEIQLNQQYGISSRMTGLLDAAADRLRSLGGWSIKSKMPYFYARRFVEKVSNESNINRMYRDKFIQSTQLQLTDSNSLDYGKFDAFI